MCVMEYHITTRNHNQTTTTSTNTETTINHDRTTTHRHENEATEHQQQQQKYNQPQSRRRLAAERAQDEFEQTVKGGFERIFPPSQTAPNARTSYTKVREGVRRRPPCDSRLEHPISVRRFVCSWLSLRALPVATRFPKRLVVGVPVAENTSSLPAFWFARQAA